MVTEFVVFSKVLSMIRLNGNVFRETVLMLGLMAECTVTVIYSNSALSGEKMGLLRSSVFLWRSSLGLLIGNCQDVLLQSHENLPEAYYTKPSANLMTPLVQA